MIFWLSQWQYYFERDRAGAVSVNEFQMAARVLLVSCFYDLNNTDFLGCAKLAIPGNLPSAAPSSKRFISKKELSD